MGGKGKIVVLKSTRLLFGLKPAQANFSTLQNLAFDENILDANLRYEIKKSYTDNLHLLSDNEEEGRIKVTTVQDSLERAGFMIKLGWNCSGQPSDFEEVSILGHHYNQMEDMLAIKSSFNLKARSKGEKPIGDIINKEEKVDSKIVEGCTKCDLLIINHSVFDTQGLIIPVTSQLKTKYRNLLLTHPSIGWDEAVPSSSSRSQGSFEGSFKMSNLRVNRYALQGWQADITDQLRLTAFADKCGQESGHPSS